MKKLILLSILIIGTLSLNAHSAEIWTDIKTYIFGPKSLYVPVGTTVTWTNYDVASHTVTADDSSYYSGLITTGQSWSYTYNTVGDYPYHCTPHPFMTGTVYVRTMANLDLLLDLTPSGAPIVIPPGGGSISYTATGTNQTATAQSFNYWTKAYLPNNSPYPAAGPYSYSIPANRSGSAGLSQNVPGAAPAGSYRYVGYLGTYSDTAAVVKAWDSFTFSKSSSADLDLGGWETVITSDWTETPANIAPQTSTSSKSDRIGLWNSPEPFNPSTMINYSLPADGQVRLEVFNISGARVATLVNGFNQTGSHQINFDASHLPSGLYVYRLNFAGESVSSKMLLVK